MNRKTSWVLLAIGLAVLLIAPAAMAQQQYVYPQKGQSADQQKKDEYDCHGWAVKQTGFDPTRRSGPCPSRPRHPSRHDARPVAPAPGRYGGPPWRGRRGSLDAEAEQRPARSLRGARAAPSGTAAAGASPAAGTGTAAGIDSAERKTAGLSQGKGRLPRGERLLGEVERVSDCPCLSHKTGIGDRRMSKAESTNRNREGCR